MTDQSNTTNLSSERNKQRSAYDLDMLSIETHITVLRGLGFAIAMMAESDDLQPMHRDALNSTADSIEIRIQALWKLLFPGDTSIAPAG